MPDSLPTLLFIKQLSIHCFRTIVTWLRWVLVAFVWLGWLPWSMRAIWRALFWLADGRWSSADPTQQGYDRHNVTASLDDATLVASSVVAEPSSVAGQPSLEPTSSMIGFSASEPILLKLMKKALSTLIFPAMSSSFGSTDSINVTATALKRRPSWLSDVKFLNSLTPSPTINNILIDTLEGQLITLLVVVSFILIFLIREWVVQQQPLDNIAEGEREAADQLIGINRPQVEARDPEPEAEHFEDSPEEETPQNGQGVIRQEELVDDRNTTPEQPEREPFDFEAPLSIRDLLAGVAGGPVMPPIRRNSDGNDGLILDIANSQQGPQFDQPRYSINMDLYRDIYRRSNGDLDEMSRIIREEGRFEELVRNVTTNNRPGQTTDGYPRFGVSDSTNMNAESVNDARLAPPRVSFSPRLPHREDADSNDSDMPNAYASTWSSSSAPLNQDQSQQASASAISDSETENSRREPSSSSGLVADNGSSGAVANYELGEETLNSSETSQAVAEPAAGLTRRVVDWFWADIDPDDLNQGHQPDAEENLIDDPAVEEPLEHPENDRNLEVDAILPGIDQNDVDAVEEADDLEGILELIGMQGPIFGLLQNGVFCALLISFTVAAGIWLPYLAGKIALVLLAHPIQFVLGVPMTAVSVFADVVLDTLIGSLGYIMYWVSMICKLVFSPLAAIVPLGEWTRPITSASLSLIDASSQRLGSVINTFFVFHEADVPMFSVLSHLALKIHEARIASLFRLAFLLGKLILHDLPLHIGSFSKAFFLGQDSSTVGNLLALARDQVNDASHDIYNRFFMPPSAWVSPNVIGLSASDGAIDFNLAVWDTKDRTIAILMGYLLASTVGLGYLKVARFISGADRGQRVEGMVAEGLHQAGGVMKVILIIGIEMIVFPLYCGALLDVALLPLFEGATVAARVEFTSEYPLTSLFVHWFIGTCYMFHFALFVSMCRKTMRSGVLCKSSSLNIAACTNFF
jgi:E3 ubiquitin-protein ligase MARCH6